MLNWILWILIAFLCCEKWKCNLYAWIFWNWIWGVLKKVFLECALRSEAPETKNSTSKLTKLRWTSLTNHNCVSLQNPFLIKNQISQIIKVLIKKSPKIAPKRTHQKVTKKIFNHKIRKTFLPTQFSVYNIPYQS